MADQAVGDTRVAESNRLKILVLDHRIAQHDGVQKIAKRRQFADAALSGNSITPPTGHRSALESPCVPSLACTLHGQGCRMGLWDSSSHWASRNVSVGGFLSAEYQRDLLGKY